MLPFCNCIISKANELLLDTTDVICWVNTCFPFAGGFFPLTITLFPTQMHFSLVQALCADLQVWFFLLFFRDTTTDYTDEHKFLKKYLTTNEHLFTLINEKDS